MKFLFLLILLLTPGVLLSQPAARLVGPSDKDFHHDYYYDENEHAFHILQETSPYIYWSPDSRRLLVTLHYATTRLSGLSGAPPSVVPTNLDYLNYSPNGTAFALLLINADSHEISPVKLPFVTAGEPYCISWWDDQSLTLVGNVTNGSLDDPYMAGHPSQRIALTRVHLADSTYEQIPIPESAWKLVEDAGGSIGFSETVRVHPSLSLVYVSFDKCQVVGGGKGTVFFDPRTGRAGLDELWGGNALREAIQLPDGFAYGKHYWSISKNQTVSTPHSHRKPPRYVVDFAFAPDGKCAYTKVIPKPRVENGQKIIDMTGPEALLFTQPAQK